MNGQMFLWQKKFVSGHHCGPHVHHSGGADCTDSNNEMAHTQQSVANGAAD